MIPPSFTYFEIDVADIWEYETQKYFNGNSDWAHIEKLKQRVEKNIIEKGVFSIDRERQPELYDERCRRLVSAYETGNPIAIGFFERHDKLYMHQQNILIDPKSRDFEYWFALKLRQYEFSIMDIDDFLIHHLKNSFNEQREEFHKFTKIVCRQYNENLFTNKVVETVNDFFDHYSPNNIDNNNLSGHSSEKKKTKLNSKGERKHKGELRTLLLKAIQEDPEYMKATDTIVSFSNVLSALKKSQFIHNDTSSDNFKAIFKNENIDPSNRIVWIGSVKELQWFVKELVYETQKVVVIKNDIWLITIDCFVSKDGTEFTELQLRNASGKRLKRKELIGNILAQL